MRISETLSKTFLYTFLLIILFFTLYPLYWMMYAGTYKPSSLFNFIFRFLPGRNLVSNFQLISASFSMVRVFLNTFFVAVVGTALVLFVNLTMGYAFAKFRFKGKKILFNIFIVTIFVGGATVMIPQFEIIVTLKLYNRLWAIILPAIYSSYSMILVRQMLLDFPSEILDSGRMDGCREQRIFYCLVLPNIIAIASTLAIITFTGFWNGYLWNLVVTSSADKYTLQVALATMYPKAGLWGYAHVKMLGAAISILPILILFIIMQKAFINSTTGAIKG